MSSRVNGFELEVEPRELSRQEGRAVFDTVARRYLGMSGEDFLRAWDAGQFETVDVDEYPGLLGVLMLLPLAR